MKTYFVECKYSKKAEFTSIKLDSIPKNIGIASSIQFVDVIMPLKDYLEKNGKKVIVGKGKQKYPGQVLGCEQSAAVLASKDVDAYIYIGDGRFHPMGIAAKTNKEVYTFNPVSSSFGKIDRKEIELIIKKRSGQLTKFLSSKEIGVIVSVKPGQNHFKEAKKLVKRFPDKNFYFILFDNVDFSQLDNFNFIQCWVNSACPRIEEDIKVINFKDLDNI